ncbi:MAG: hydroxyacid dehydrogenase [Clostridiales bacterium]|nr:hydroxyacid dehydrogenase [Clostridiales bacterium]
MKLVIIEPLGVEEELLLRMAREALGPEVELTYYGNRTTDPAELIARGREADVIAVSNLPLGAEVIAGFEKLRLLTVAFTGVDHIALEACRARDIAVCNCAGYSTAAVADLVFGLLISLYRNICPCEQRCRSGGTKDGLIGFELEGKRFGVVGTGAIGSRVAAIARAFGCEVLAYSRTERPLEGVRYTDLDTLLSTCDIVSLHTPLNEQTRGLINAQRLALMKPTAVLINTARGPVVDSAALAEALNRGALGGACLDVFDIEPPLDPADPLLKAKNTLVTPHIAFATKEALIKRAAILFENVAAFRRGTPQNCV